MSNLEKNIWYIKEIKEIEVEELFWPISTSTTQTAWIRRGETKEFGQYNYKNIIVRKIVKRETSLNIWWSFDNSNFKDGGIKIALK